MFSVSPEIYTVLSTVSRWLFAFFALMLLLFAFAWQHADRKEHRERFKNLPGAGTVGELVVLSGSDQLSVNTWFPVPREGVLGSLRSCDLVVPCPGVRSQHLDFSWQDGTGLLIRPRLGCEVLVDGVPVSRRGAFADTPLLHGSTLQVGSAVLRLQLFSALSAVSRPHVLQAAEPVSAPGAWTVPAQPPVQVPCASEQFWQTPQEPVPFSPDPYLNQPVPQQPESVPVPPSEQPAPQPEMQPGTQRRKRADRWKEDWSE